MLNLIGWLSILIIFFLIIVWGKKNKYLINVILVAFLLRVVLVVLQIYSPIILPDSTGDTIQFDLMAIEFSRNQGLSIIFDFFKKDSFLISRIIAVFYTIFGESKFLALVISVVLGTMSVYLIYYICFELWDYRSAKKAAWVVALFPTLVLYSSLILRETYIVFLLLIALIGIINFEKKNSYSSLFVALASFYMLSLFHGAMSLGGFIYIFYLTIKLSKKQLLNLNSKSKVNKFFLIISILTFVTFITAIHGNISIPYIPTNTASFFFNINSGLRDDASYPSWLYINNHYDLIPKIIVKVFYFLYSPFIWDIKSTYHILGLLDALLFFILTVYLIKNRNSFKLKPITSIFILMLILYIIVFSLGIGNFGTGIRHKSKLVVLFIILAAPQINRFIITKKII
jgi:hypothetical protein